MALFRKNQRGMSLVEVLIMIGIMGIISSVMASLMNYTLSSTKYVEQKAEQNDLNRSVDLVLSDKNACGLLMSTGGLTGPGNSFTTAGFAGRNITSFNQCSAPAACQAMIVPGSPAASQLKLSTGISIQSITLGPSPAIGALTDISAKPPTWSSSWGPTAAATPAIMYHRYPAEVDFTVQGNTGKSFKQMKKQIVLFVNPSDGKADLCESVSSSAEEACRNLMGGVYDATKTPNCTIPTMVANGQGLYASDITNSNAYAMIIGQSNSGAAGSNMVVMGNNPGITFSDTVLSGGAAPAPVDSGSGFMQYNTSSGELVFKARSSGVEGPVHLWAHNAPVKFDSHTQVETWINGTNRLMVDASGVHMSGNAWVNGSVVTTSDARLKTQIKDLDDPLSKILQLHGVTFKYKDEKKFGGGTHSGYIAQEVKEVIPTAVVTNGEGFFNVAYTEIISYITDAFKQFVSEVNAKFSENDRRIADLEKKVDELSRQLQAERVRCEGVSDQ